MSKDQVTSLRVDRAVWREARKAAIDAGITMQEFIDRALRSELEKAKKHE